MWQPARWERWNFHFIRPKHQRPHRPLQPGERTVYNWRLIDASQFDVVLVSPRNPLNIGAAARAMANFGFARLTVASTYGPHWEEA
jgi:hypothetical protein